MQSKEDGVQLNNYDEGAFSDFDMASDSDRSVSSTSSRPKVWHCEYDGCTKSFSRPSQLTEHQETVHRGIKPFGCPECGKAFARKSHLERHMFCHSSEKPYKCSICQKGTTTLQQLRRHEITHTKSFNCPYEGCGETFYKHPQLRSHILSVHLDKLTCEFCGKKFQRPYRLQAHISKHHNPDTIFKYQCSHKSCVESFKTWTALQQHIKEHHPKLPCPICNKACVGDAGLAMHMKIHDSLTVIRNWKCEVCHDLSFAKKSDLVSHYQECHQGLVVKLLENEALLETAVSDRHPPVSNSEPTQLKRTARRIDFNAQSELDSIKTEVTLRKHLDAGISATTLLLNSAGRKLKCPYSKCYRTFKTRNKYDVHIQKHKIHELKLKILEDSDRNDKSKTNPKIEEVDKKGMTKEVQGDLKDVDNI
ncbi:LADA_0C12750g1_1 [Lachancea dasiensis]|uniref:LADA_0C12750g1_1 n=1 Tax=Lachancea dasiensis TaxID=1072105 RepID=A0A1G4J1X0_9SACH|nr:LADA_0C12750g1_1 [Lachancea dasiensis]